MYIVPLDKDIAIGIVVADAKLNVAPSNCKQFTLSELSSWSGLRQLCSGPSQLGCRSCNRLGDGVLDPSSGIGGEVIKTGSREVVESPHQSEVAFLNQIQQRKTARRVSLRNRQDIGEAYFRVAVSWHPPLLRRICLLLGRDEFVLRSSRAQPWRLLACTSLQDYFHPTGVTPTNTPPPRPPPGSEWNGEVTAAIATTIKSGCFRPPVFCEKFDLANCRPDQLY